MAFETKLLSASNEEMMTPEQWAELDKHIGEIVREAIRCEPAIADIIARVAGGHGGTIHSVPRYRMGEIGPAVPFPIRRR